MSQAKIKTRLLMSMDPGKKSVGVAVFYNGKLKACHNVKLNIGSGPKQLRAVGHLCGQWFKDNRPGRTAFNDATFGYEQMVFRKDKPEAVKDLLDLAVMTGVVLGDICALDVRRVLPGNWTKGKEKPVNHPLIRARLSDEELLILDKALKGSSVKGKLEVYDAVGIGLYLLWRL